MKKDPKATILSTLSLTMTLFMIIPIESSPGVGDYDPWYDLNDDGKIDIKDIAVVARAYGSLGEPINKTALLLSLNKTVQDLQDQISYLNASLVDLCSRVETLENQSGWLSLPAYDSGWIPLTVNEHTTFVHNLNTSEILVYLIGRDISGNVHQCWVGPDKFSSGERGVGWGALTDSELKIYRALNDYGWNKARIVIWKISGP